MEPFKNLLGKDAAVKISAAMRRAFGSHFQSKKFLHQIEKHLEPLELKQRSTFLSEHIERCIDPKPKNWHFMLLETLKSSDQDSVGLHGFLVMPLTDLISRCGIDEPENSMAILKEMTKVFTAEFAIRDFILLHQKFTLEQLLLWTKDESEHVRRLCSEGTRPLLPWGKKLNAFVSDPKLTWKILENLKDDPSLYVQKSIANHLNDHSKNHPDFVLEKLKSWGNTFIVKNALRTLIKKGHPKALALLGVKHSAFELISMKIDKKKLVLGGKISCEIVVRNKTQSSQILIWDHAIELLKKNGSYNTKVFKGIQTRLAAGQQKTIQANIHLKKVTTRTYYPGIQYVAPRINGVLGPKQKFQLIE